MKRYRVAIVETSALIAEGIASILRSSATMEVVGTYAAVQEVEPLLAAGGIDVVVAAVGLCHQLEESSLAGQMPVVGLQSGLTDEATLRRFNGVVTLYTAAEDIIRIVSEACQQPTEHNMAESHELSEREKDVLVLVAKGFTNKEIASELNISPHTVMSHRKNIVHKTGIRSVAGLTVYAVLNKLIDSEQL